jgi:hypothetical protein
MNREEYLQLMSCRLYDLLGLMFAKWRSYMPKVGWPTSSCGFSSGGSVSEFEDLEDQLDTAAVRVLEAGWGDLTPAERTAIEVVLGGMPNVWTVRPGVYESAIAKLEKRLRMIGA